MCPTRTCVRNQAGNHLSTRHRVMRRPFGVHGSSGGPAASQSPGYFAAGPGWNLRAFRYACGCADLLWPVMKGSQASDDATGSLGPGRLQLPAMRVLVAPDCYGDSLSAVEAAAAIATGWTRSRPGDSFIVAPQSDGGPGFVEVLGSRLGETRRLRVCGPLNTVVNAAWAGRQATPDHKPAHTPNTRLPSPDRTPIAGTMGHGQGVRAAEGRGHGHRRSVGRPSGGMGD